MIVNLETNIDKSGERNASHMNHLSNLPNIQVRVHEEVGTQDVLTEINLIGNTSALSLDEIQQLPGVEQVVRVSGAYRVLGRHKHDSRSRHFEYNGVQFNQNNLKVFAGLCAVATPEHVEAMMRALKEPGLVCTRMGAYKPRTNPYSFQGHGKNCLPNKNKHTNKYGIK